MISKSFHKEPVETVDNLPVHPPCHPPCHPQARRAPSAVPRRLSTLCTAPITTTTAFIP